MERHRIESSIDEFKNILLKHNIAFDE